MRVARPLSILLTLAILFSSLGQTVIYAADGAPPEPESGAVSEDAPPAEEDTASTPEAEEEAPGEPGTDAPGGGSAESATDDGDSSTEPADADAPLSTDAPVADDQSTLELDRSYLLEQTLTVPAGAVLTLTSASGGLSRIARAPGAGVNTLITVEAGAVLILENIILDGAAEGEGALVTVYGELRLNQGASLCDNGPSPAITVEPGGKCAMTDGELRNCGLSGGYAVENEGEFTMSGGSICYNDVNIIDNLRATAFLNSGQLEISRTSTISANTCIINNGVLYFSGGTLTGAGALSGAAPSGTGIVNNGQLEQSGGIVQSFALGVENNGAYALSGGTLTGNTADGAESKGGGIRNTGDLSVSSGAVSGNSAGLGGEIYTTADLILTGKPVIGTKDSLSGIYLAKADDGSYPLIVVTGALGNGTLVSLEGSEHPSRNVLQRRTASGAGRLSADELGSFVCRNGVGGLKYDTDQSLYRTGSLQEIIRGSGTGSASNPVVIYLDYNTVVDETIEIAAGTAARNIKLVGGSLVRGEGAAAFAGVMLRIPAGSSLVLDSVEIDGSLSEGAATGALVQNAGSLTLLAGSLLHGNRLAGPSGSGAGVVNLENATFTMSGGEISGNTASRPASPADGLHGSGGGVYSAGSFTMTGGAISGNSADDYGAGVYLNKSTMTLKGGQIEHNATGGSGGGIYSYGGTLAMSGGSVRSNEAYQGGGVFLEGYGAIKDKDAEAPVGSFSLSGGAISGNVAHFKGGGVMNSDSVLTLTGGTISGNTAEKYGGGVYTLRDPAYIANSEFREKLSARTFEMKGGAIEGNTAACGGGLLNEGIFTLTKGAISDNTANFGGGIYGLHDPDFQITVSGGTVSGNKAVAAPLCTWEGDAPKDSEPYGSGGGLLSHGPLAVKGGTFSGNSAEALGGGILNRGYLRITGGTIKDNTAATGWDLFAGAAFGAPDGDTDGENDAHDAIIDMSGKPVIGSKTAPGGLWLDARSARTPHVHIAIVAALTSGCFVRLEGNGSLENVEMDYINSLPEEKRDEYVVAVIKQPGTGNFTSAEKNMFFCGALDLSLGLTSYSKRKLELVKVSGALQDLIDNASGGTAKKPVVLTLSHNHTLEKTLTIANSSSGAARHITLTSPGVALLRGAGLSGAMINVPAGSTLNLTDLTLDGSVSGGADGPIVENAGTLTLKTGALLRNNTSSRDGGAIVNSGILLMQGGTLSGNTTAGNGGGVYNSGRFEMTGGAITGGNNPIGVPVTINAQNGGGVAGSGTFVLQGGTITGNHAAVSGGGLWLDAPASATLKGTQVGTRQAGNTAAHFGGGIYSAGALALRGGEVAHNKSADGGGIYSIGELSLTGGDIAYNTATGNGGGILQNGGGLLADGTARMLGNTAENGGGLYADSARFSFGGGSAVNNTATGAGGGLYLAGSSGDPATLQGTFTGNSAAEGGGLYATSTGTDLTPFPLTLSSATFDGNTARDGAGLYFTNANASLFSVKINGGTASQDGGGIYLESGSAALHSGYLSGNRAARSGGGVYLRSGTFSAYGGELAENTAATGGGIYSGPLAEVNIHSGRIVRNGGAGTASGGGLLVAGAGKLRGGIIEGNTATAIGTDIALAAGSALAAQGKPQVGGRGAGIDTTDAPLLLDGSLLTGARLVMESVPTGHTVATGADGYLPVSSDLLFLSSVASAGFTIDKVDNNAIKTTPNASQTGISVYYNHENGTLVEGDISGGTHRILLAAADETKAGYTARAWTDGIRHYDPGDSVVVRQALVLTPVWTPRAYTIEYYWQPDGVAAVPYPAGAQLNPGDTAANPARYVIGRAGPLSAPVLRPAGTAFLGWRLYDESTGVTGATITDLTALTPKTLDDWADDDWADNTKGILRLIAATESDPAATPTDIPAITGVPGSLLTLEPGDTHRLSTDSPGEVFWFSSDSSIVTVDQNGLVWAKKSGAATIGLAAPGGNGHSAVAVYVRSTQPLAFLMAGTASQSLAVLQGESVDLASTLLFDGQLIKDIDQLEISSATSANPSIAGCSTALQLGAVKAGTTTLAVTVRDSRPAGDPQVITAVLTVRVLPATAALTTLTLKPTEKDLLPGKSQKLTASVGKAQLRSLSWEIAAQYPQSGNRNDAVITLDAAKSTVTAANPGTAVVRCTAVDLLGNTKTTTCSLRVVQRAASVTIFRVGASESRPSYGLPFAGIASSSTSTDLRLEARFIPENATITAASWKSSNSKIATVDQNGVVTPGEKAGTATITATAADGSKKKHSVKVTVGVPVSGIVLLPPAGDDGSGITLNLGKSRTIKPVSLQGVSGKAPTNKTLVYRVAGGGSDVVTVSKKGVVKAVGLGEAVIEVLPALPLVEDGLPGATMATLKVTVKAPLTALKIDQKAFTLQSGHHAQLSCTLNSGGPVDSADLQWTSSNPAVLAVNSQTGRATALPVTANTKVSVTVKDTVSGRTATVAVTVTNKAQIIANELGFAAKKQPPATLAVGKSWKPSLTFTPAKTSCKNVVWEVKSGGEYIQLNAAAGTIKALSVDPAAPQDTWVELVARASVGTAATETVRIRIVGAVKSLKMSQAKATLQTGNTLPLSVTATPATTSTSTDLVSWKSSNTKVATVNENGLVTALKSGSATITATASDGSKKKTTAKITVRQRVEDVSFVKTGGAVTQSMATGAKLTLKPSFNTGGQGKPYNRTLIWASSDPAVATVTAKGVVRALSPTAAGQPVTITATSADNPAAVAVCTLTITESALTTVAIAQGDALTVAPGYGENDPGITLTATVSPAFGGTLIWSSSNPSVATITPDPENPARAVLRPGAGAGSTVITVSAGSRSGSARVTVSPGAPKVTSLALNLSSTLLGLNKSVTLKATAAPTDAPMRQVEWRIVESYDANGNPADGIATVSAAGKVTAKAQGTVVVQARSLDGGHTATCTIQCVLKP